MAKNIDAKLKSIQDIFSNSQGSILGRDGIFIIPDYQRAYNWKFNEQCDKLWQDIESFIENGKNETYFLGSIIINNDSEQLYVIDGQQRMTTFMLLLKALLIKINNFLQNFSSDIDAESIKDALENRRREIINCLYSIDEDDVSLVVKGGKKLSDLHIKYCNNSINEEYPLEVKTILNGTCYDEIERNVVTIKYKQKNNKYSNFFKNFKFFMDKLVLHPVSFQSMEGYSLDNLILASCVLNCQSIFTCSAFRFIVQIRTCSLKLSKSGSGLASAWRLIMPISISAISSQLPCFGV